MVDFFRTYWPWIEEKVQQGLDFDTIRKDMWKEKGLGKFRATDILNDWIINRQDEFLKEKETTNA